MVHTNRTVCVYVYGGGWSGGGDDKEINSNTIFNTYFLIFVPQIYLPVYCLFRGLSVQFLNELSCQKNSMQRILIFCNNLQ